MKLPLLPAKIGPVSPGDSLACTTSHTLSVSSLLVYNDYITRYQKPTVNTIPSSITTPLHTRRSSTCSAGDVTCQNSCMPQDPHCQAGTYCIGGSCCPNGSICARASKCEIGYEACGAGCMPQGSVCCGSSYCESGSVCSQENTCRPTQETQERTISTTATITDSVLKNMAQTSTPSAPSTSNNPISSDPATTQEESKTVRSTTQRVTVMETRTTVADVTSAKSTLSESTASRPPTTENTATIEKPTKSDEPTSETRTTLEKPTTSVDTHLPNKTTQSSKVTTSDEPTIFNIPTTTMEPVSSDSVATFESQSTSDGQTSQAPPTTSSQETVDTSMPTSTTTEPSTSSDLTSSNNSLEAATTTTLAISDILRTAIPTSAQTNPDARCFLSSGHASDYTTPPWYTALPSDAQSYYASASLEPSAIAACRSTETPSASSPKSPLSPAIVGAIIGGAAFAAALATFLILWIRSAKRRRQSGTKGVATDGEGELGDDRSNTGLGLNPVRDDTARWSFWPMTEGSSSRSVVVADSSQVLPSQNQREKYPAVGVTAQNESRLRYYPWPVAPVPSGSSSHPVSQRGLGSHGSKITFTPPTAFGADWLPPRPTGGENHLRVSELNGHGPSHQMGATEIYEAPSNHER